jgi:hypothetical protein
MVIVIGQEPRALVALADRLPSRALDARDPAAGEQLFDAVWEDRPRAIVVAEPLTVEAPQHPIDWDAVLRAARAPSRPRIVWCTMRPEGPAGTRLRRSGLPYTIVRAGVLVDAIELGLGAVAGERVLVDRDLPVPEIGLTTLLGLEAALVDAITSERVGHVFDARYMGNDAWLRVVDALGGRATPSPRWVARGLGWLGIRTLVHDAAPDRLSPRSEGSPSPFAAQGGGA